MVIIQGKLIDPWHVELADAIPPGEESIEVHLVKSGESESFEFALLTHNPSFDFLRDEPDLYE